MKTIKLDVTTTRGSIKVEDIHQIPVYRKVKVEVKNWLVGYYDKERFIVIYDCADFENAKNLALERCLKGFPYELKIIEVGSFVKRVL